MRANQRTLPQRVDRDGVNAQTPRQRQPVHWVIDTENLVTSCHPDSIGKFRLPERGSPGFIQQRHKLPGFFNERLCAEDEIRDDVRIDDGVHERPNPIHASTSLTVGRRVCWAHPASICASTDRRSARCASSNSRSSCSMEWRRLRARALRDLTSWSGTLRMVSVGIDAPCRHYASTYPASRPIL